MNSYGTIIEPGTLRLERVLPGPIERLWDYLTDSEKRAKWFAGGAMEGTPGAKVDLLFQHANLSNEKVPPDKFRKESTMVHTIQILRWEPPRLLAWSWPYQSGEIGEVTFELTPKGSDVLLVITHTKLFDKGVRTNISAGWDSHVGILEDVLRGEEPRGFWSTHARLEREYATRV